MEALIQAVLSFALSHYEDGGWDVIVETYERAEIAAVIERAGATTEAAAIDAFRPLVEVWAERQAEADSYREPREDFHSDGFGGDGFVSSASYDYEPYSD